MRKIILLAIISLPLFAGFFPQTKTTYVASVSGKNIKLKSSLGRDGMSGIVVHKYGNDLSSITTSVIQTNGNIVTFLNKDILSHDELPSVKTNVKAGDKVIGGYLYNTVLVLAPSAKVYDKITSSSNKKWVHPDIFAVYLAQNGDNKVTRKNLYKFAKDYQIGLIYIVKQNKAILFDPLSQKVVGAKSISKNPKVGEFPFYMHFKNLNSGWFSKDSREGNYYREMESI